MAVHERMRQDWLDALDAAAAAGWIDGRRVGYLGMSMGARYGLPVCRCARRWVPGWSAR